MRLLIFSVLLVLLPSLSFAQFTDEAVLLIKFVGFEDEKEEAVYEVAQEILDTKKLSDPTYKNALTVLGEKTLFELTVIIGYYACIAIQMNCFDVGISEGEEPRLKD